MFHRWESRRQVLGAASLRLLLRRVDLHRDLLRLAREALPESLAAHCLDCVAHEDGRLTLYTDSPVWGGQLRFHAPDILAHLRAQGRLACREIVVRNWITPLPKPKPIKETPSLPAVEAIQTAAAYCSSPELAEALNRLGQTLARFQKS